MAAEKQKGWDKQGVKFSEDLQVEQEEFNEEAQNIEQTVE